jgi:hypothetical protein
VEGITRSDCVAAVMGTRQMGLLRDALGDNALHVEFLDSSDWYVAAPAAKTEGVHQGLTPLNTAPTPSPATASASAVQSISHAIGSVDGPVIGRLLEITAAANHPVSRQLFWHRQLFRPTQ